MNGLNVLQKRLHLSYKHPANNFLRGLNRTVENSSLGGFSRGEYGYDLPEFFFAETGNRSSNSVYGFLQISFSVFVNDVMKEFSTAYGSRWGAILQGSGRGRTFVIVI